MKQTNKIIEVYGLWFADLVSIPVAFLVATYLRFGNFRDMGDKNVHFLVCLCLMLFCTIYSFFIDWNRNFLKRDFTRESWAVLQYNGIMIMVISVLLFATEWGNVFSRLTLGFFFFLNLALSLSVHMLVKKILRTYYASEYNAVKVMVVTAVEIIIIY